MTNERIEELWMKAVAQGDGVKLHFARLVAAETARECAEITHGRAELLESLAVSEEECDNWRAARQLRAIIPDLKVCADAIRRKFLERKGG